MDTNKAVKRYHRNIVIILGIVLAIFIAIPVFVKTPYIINIFVLFNLDRLNVLYRG